MPEELMKSFLEELIESLEGTADAMRILLQYYHVSSEEEKCQNHIDKIRGGLSWHKIKELSFHAGLRI